MSSKTLVACRSLALAAVVACSGGEQPPVDFASFDTAVDISDVDLAQVTPAEPFTYLELRQARAWSSLDFQVVSSHGDACADATDATACDEALRTAEPTTSGGFQWGCHPDDCYKYFVVNRGDDVEVLATGADVLALLGAIDNRAEALLLTASHDYWWSASDATRGGIRDAEGGGYEVIATRTTSLCDPIEVTGYLLGITTRGAVEILESWNVELLEGWCS